MSDNRNFSEMKSEQLWGLLEEGVNYTKLSEQMLQQLAKRIDRELDGLPDPVYPEFSSIGATISVDMQSAILWLHEQRKEITKTFYEQYGIELPARIPPSANELKTIDELTEERHKTTAEMLEIRLELEDGMTAINKYSNPDVELPPLDDREQILNSEVENYNRLASAYRNANLRLLELDDAAYRIAAACGNSDSTLKQLETDRVTLKSVSKYIADAARTNTDLINETERKWTKGFASMFDSQEQAQKFMNQLLAQKKIFGQNALACSDRIKQCENLIRKKQVEAVMQPKKSGKLILRTEDTEDAEPPQLAKCTIEVDSNVMESSPAPVREQKENITASAKVNKSIKLKH